ncbi:hypothetical protein AQUCO_02900004v1 [Aquilegia coerulea]|uniref:Uncharacterized protein n=1 Tax=Aquilegia coerulea TaxID=218851 RepID=A0A2G5D2W9_AQUCA|nr:hypothetical protein AQUCO_02900004v1 [Aquilegia coerulea]PIA37856.1 hypothetical protein AQUCO_02900004v1 [Aquilegia coerulea]PIA37858.1 hypothetical protein AQUCO_02900004v1 [Aquilegia coerulea]
MENSTRFVQQFSQEQLERVRFYEKRKYEYRKEGLELRKKANKVIIEHMKWYFFWIGSQSAFYRQTLHYEQWSSFWKLMLSGFLIASVHSWNTYSRINYIIYDVDRLLQRDEVLRSDVDTLTTSVRNSMERFQVTHYSGGGPTVVSDARILPHTLDHGECLSLLALLEKLVKEPSVGSNFRFIYGNLVTLLALFGMCFYIGLTAVSYYTMKGNEGWKYNDLNFELFNAT